MPTGGHKIYLRGCKMINMVGKQNMFILHKSNVCNFLIASRFFSLGDQDNVKTEAIKEQSSIQNTDVKYLYTSQI